MRTAKARRLFEIVRAVKDDGGSVKAGNMAELFGTYQRAIYRDLETLIGIGVLVRADRGKYEIAYEYRPLFGLDQEYDDAWLCVCGNFVEDGMHCPICGHEPPWGCGCSTCEDRYLDRYDDGYDGFTDPYDADLVAAKSEGGGK